MATFPLALSVKDITNVLEAHPVPLDRATLDACVFALDDIFLAEVHEEMAKADKKQD